MVAEFTDYYNHHRSHMSRDHLPPMREEPDEVEKAEQRIAVCFSYLTLRGELKE